MLAGRLTHATHRFAVEDVPVPEPGPGQVLVKVEAAGVCLSDLHVIDGSLPPVRGGAAVTLGHEVAGTVTRLGEGVTGWAPGARVLLWAGELGPDGEVLTRGVDYDGGWAEYALATAYTLVAIPDDLPFEQAAIIPDAVSTPWAAVTTTGAVRPAEAVGVWGVGGLGAHAVQLLRLVGAAPIVAVDPLPEARRRAVELGADVALDPADDDLRPRILEETGGAGLAAAFDFAGVGAVREQAVTCLGRGGRLVLVGLTHEPLTITNGTAVSYLQQKIMGHFGSAPEHIGQLIALTRRHRLDLGRSVSAVVPLADAAQAVERLASKRDSPIRIVLRP